MLIQARRESPEYTLLVVAIDATREELDQIHADHGIDVAEYHRRIGSDTLAALYDWRKKQGLVLLPGWRRDQSSPK